MNFLGSDKTMSEKYIQDALDVQAKNHTVQTNVH